MARGFNGTSDKIVTGIGGLSFAFGPGTMAAIFRTGALPGAGVYPMIFTAGTALTTGYAIYWNGDSNKFNINLNDGDGDGPGLSANKWYYGAWDKATGTVTPRYHLYDYATNSWTHGNSTFGGMPNSSAPLTKATFGIDGLGSAGLWWGGTTHLVGVWNAVMTDAQHESMAFSLLPLFQVQPKALWLLDQSSTGQKVRDITGGGADESSLTGTSISAQSVPVWSYGTPAIEVTHPAVVATAAGNVFGRRGNQGLIMRGHTRRGR